MFKEIIEFAMQHGSFDGGDQGLLNQFFDDWKNADIQHHLSFTYNMAWQAYYSYKPALKEFGAEIKVFDCVAFSISHFNSLTASMVRTGKIFQSLLDSI